MRRDPLAVRKATLADVLARAAPGLRLNEHLDEEDGPLIFSATHATARHLALLDEIVDHVGIVRDQIRWRAGH
jgi:hypothetical protein